MKNLFNIIVFILAIPVVAVGVILYGVFLFGWLILETTREALWREEGENG